MNYADIIDCSVVDGEGCRVALYCCGCTLGCSGCHNPEAQDFNYGRTFSLQESNIIKMLAKPYIKGLTLTGGHPLEDKNFNDIYSLIKEVRWQLPDKTIWIYSGFTWDEILLKKNKVNGITAYDIVKECDVLVDGRYKEELRDITLPFCGSSNQRIIDIQETLKKGEIVLWNIKY